MYSLADSWTVAVYTTRAMYGTIVMPIASITLTRPGPRTAAIAMASSTTGKAKSTSSTRITAFPQRLPK
jgi:hypothetical protein